MNAINGLNKSGQLLVASVSKADWEGVKEDALEMLWDLAELRPDFEELPSWIEDDITSENADKPLETAIGSLRHCHVVLRNICDRYGDQNDRGSLECSERVLVKTRKDMSLSEYAEYLADVSNRAS